MSAEPLIEAVRQQAETCRQRALDRLYRGECAEALALYDEALESARETGDGAFVDWIYACRAAAAAETGPAAEELIELKKILLRSRDVQTAFRAAYTSARIYEIQRNYRRAEFYNGIARKHASQLDDPLLVAGAESQRGNILSADSRFAEAAEAYANALRASAPPAEGSNPVARAIWTDNLGYCLLCQDRDAEGLALVHEALDTLEKEGATGYTVIPLVDLCYGYLQADRYPEARYFGEAALDRLPDSGSEPSVERNTLYLLGEACHLCGDASAAQFYFDKLARHYPDFRNLRAYLDVFDFRGVINLRG